uniref:Uncharacterized protein n=1 Tax=Fagus sylvatica TaxID=28930 RepID=A0A2N9GMB5_FAGSY
MDRGWVSISFWVQVDGRFFYGAVGGSIDGLDLMVGLYVDGEIDGFDVGAIGASMPWIVGGFQFHFGFGLMIGFSTV